MDRSLEGYRGWGHQESDTANQEHTRRDVKRVIKTPIKDTDDDVYKSGWKNAHISDHCFLVAQMVKNLPTIQETQVGSLDQEDPLEKKMANPLQYSCLENSMDQGVWWTQSMGSQRVGHD